MRELIFISLYGFKTRIVDKGFHYYYYFLNKSLIKKISIIFSSTIKGQKCATDIRVTSIRCVNFLFSLATRAGKH